MTSKLEQIRAYLKEPYPYYYEDRKKRFLLLLLISVLSFGFSYFFEPFEVNVTEHKISTIWVLTVHAFLPLPIAFLYFSVMNSRMQETNSWTLGKELLHLSTILLLIGIGSFLVRDFIYTNPDNWSLRYFWEEIRNTFLIGFLLLLIILPLNLERLIQKHSAIIKKLHSKDTIKAFNNTIIAIQNDALQENLELHMADFLFAKVESNYTEVFTFSSNTVNKILIRIPLKVLEKQLKANPEVFKTHRSYLVNLNAITAISGNAQGYQLNLKNCPILVPVSRSNIIDFNKAYTKE